MSRIRLTTKNWSEFQHYKDRAPLWIKLHRGLLDNFEWHALPDASKALAPMLWLIASEYEGGVIESTTRKLCFRLRYDETRFLSALNPLIEAGFFLAEHDDSGVLAEAERTASLEKRREEIEKREETEKREVGAVAPSPTAEAVEIFNRMAAEHDWPQVQVLNPTRRTALVNCLKAIGGIEGWQTLLAKALASDFLMGRTKRSDEHANWRFDFDFLVKPKRYIKLMEGGYDNPRNGPVQGKSGLSAALAGLAD